MVLYTVELRLDSFLHCGRSSLIRTNAFELGGPRRIRGFVVHCVASCIMNHRLMVVRGLTLQAAR